MRLPLIVFLIAGCASEIPSAGTVGALQSPQVLVAISPAAPTRGDERPRTPVAFRDAEGNLSPVGDASVFLPRWLDGAALIDAGRLYQVWPDGRRRMLAANVAAIASDGERLVFVVEDNLEAVIRLHDGSQVMQVAGGLASAGVMRLDAERVIFVGAAPGGVAGVWTAPLDGSGPRCATNCTLRTGEPWLDDFVPPPSDPAELEAP